MLLVLYVVCIQSKVCKLQRFQKWNGRDCVYSGKHFLTVNGFVPEVAFSDVVSKWVQCQRSTIHNGETLSPASMEGELTDSQQLQ